MAKTRKIYFTATSGDVYVTDCNKETKANEVGEALLTTDMIAAVNTRTDRLESLLVNHVVSYTLDDGLTKEDINSIMQASSRQEQKDDVEDLAKDSYWINKKIH